MPRAAGAANDAGMKRRESLAAGGGLVAAVVGAGVLRPRAARAGAAVEDEIRVGLVGCGGRGAGAAREALLADPGVRLVALGDLFEDRLEAAHAQLAGDAALAARVDAPPARRFVGFDAFRGVIDAGVDAVLLASPPHFRPQHLQAAIAAGKHVFAEKPCAVDAPGVRAVLAAAAEARAKRLSVVSGLCFRYHDGYREVARRVRAGAIGDIVAIEAHDFRGPIWVKPRRPGWTDMEWQTRNWYYFPWLSGDFNVEQHVHSLDICAWAMGDRYPARASGTGGRAQRSAADHGAIYDHHAVTYEYDLPGAAEDGVRVFSHCRQLSGAAMASHVKVLGTKGTALFSEKRVAVADRPSAGGKRAGKLRWESEGPFPDKYQAEQSALFAAIRRGRPVNDGDFMAKSTLMGVLGRMATYTGQLVTWEEAMNGTEALAPERYAFDAPAPAVSVAVPGGRRGAGGAP